MIPKNVLGFMFFFFFFLLFRQGDLGKRVGALITRILGVLEYNSADMCEFFFFDNRVSGHHAEGPKVRKLSHHQYLARLLLI